MDKLPRYVHYCCTFGDIAREHFSKEGAFYLDLWPLRDLFLVNVSPSVSAQIHTNPHMSMQRPGLLSQFFKTVCGGPNMFDLPEEKWKRWRAIFS